jgi:hypothetical protein
LHLFQLRKKEAFCLLASGGCCERGTSALFRRKPAETADSSQTGI